MRKFTLQREEKMENIERQENLFPLKRRGDISPSIERFRRCKRRGDRIFYDEKARGVESAPARSF